MDGKFLGKISYVKFGIDEGRFGLHLTLSGDYACQTSIICWDPTEVIPDKHHKWTEEDREKELIKMIKKVSKLLNEAKVKEVNGLLNIPIEMEFNNNRLKDWRILTEVL